MISARKVRSSIYISRNQEVNHLPVSLLTLQLPHLVESMSPFLQTAVLQFRNTEKKVVVGFLQ